MRMATRTPSFILVAAELGAAHMSPPNDIGHLNLLGIVLILGLCYWGETDIGGDAGVGAAGIYSGAASSTVADACACHAAWPSAFAVLMLMTLRAGFVYYSANQAVELSAGAAQVQREDSPENRTAFRETNRTASRGSRDGGSGDRGGKFIRNAESWTDMLTRGVGSLTSGAAGGVVYSLPRLFHAELAAARALVNGHAVSIESRHTAYVTLGLISQ